MKAWYLIHTKPRQEEMAKENLERQGYFIYFPRAPVRRRKRGRAYTTIGPMFPRYLFISLSHGTDDWGPIRSTIGVSSLVRFGQQPAQVPQQLIDTLKAREDDEGIQVIHTNSLKRGEKVRIAEGAFEGYEGIFQTQSGKDRVIILMQIIERQVKLEIEQDKIEAIS